MVKSKAMNVCHHGLLHRSVTEFLCEQEKPQKLS